MRPRIQRLPATHLKLIEHARSNRGNTVYPPRDMLAMWAVVTLVTPSLLMIWAGITLVTPSLLVLWAVVMLVMWATICDAGAVMPVILVA